MGELMLWHDVALGLLRGICIACMGAIVLFDMTMKLIPTPLCWAMGAVGLLAQAYIGGYGSTAAGAIGACCVLVACLGVDALAQAGKKDAGRQQLIGGGDVRCMMALALATGPKWLPGALVCFAAASVCGLVARALGKLQPGEPFPFAPFLALWLLIGLP